MSVTAGSAHAAAAKDSTRTVEASGWTPSRSGQERRTRAWARLTAAAARGDASAWRHLVAVHAGALWQFALDCGLDREQAEQACELAWARAAQALEERPHVGHAFGHGLRATVVDEAHRNRRTYQRPRPHLDLVAAAPDGRPAGGGDVDERERSGRRSGDAGQRPTAARRREPVDTGAPPYIVLFERIAEALEGIEQGLEQRRGPIVLPDARPQQESDPRR